MSNKRKIECKMKRMDRPFKRRERAELSRQFRALFIGNNLEYLIITNNDK